MEQSTNPDLDLEQICQKIPFKYTFQLFGMHQSVHLQSGFAMVNILGLQAQMLVCKIGSDFAKDLPTTSISLHSNPLLFPGSWLMTCFIWHQSTLFLRLIPHNTSQFTGPTTEMGLYALRWDHSTRTFTKVCSDLVIIDLNMTARIPVPSRGKLTSFSAPSHFKTLHGHVMCISLLHRNKHYWVVHCFYKGKFVTIGGTNLGYPGYYKATGYHTIVSERRNQSIVSFYGCKLKPIDLSGSVTLTVNCYILDY